MEDFGKMFSACGEAIDYHILEQLLNDVDVNTIRNSTGETLAQVAVKCGNEESLKYLVKRGVDINSIDQNGENLLILALRENKPAIAHFLVETGINLNTRSEKNNDHALHVAVKLSDGKLVELMILNGADINAQDSRGYTCLHLACIHGNSSIACMLIHLGAKIGIPNLHGDTSMHESCRREMFQVVELMCSRDCPINEPNRVGNTPLHVAAKTGNLDIIRLLLLSGADIDVFNKDGMRSEDLALVQGHTEASDLLSKLGNSIAVDKLKPLCEQVNLKRCPFDSIKIKVFGNKGSGKTTLIESLKCSYLWKFVKKLYSDLTTEEDRRNRNSVPWIEAPSVHYTRGIDVHQANISGVGKVSLWEFSGFEPYVAYYDFFVGDPSCIHIVTFNVLDEQSAIRNQLFFWLDFIRSRISFHETIGFGGTQLWPPHVIFVATHATEGGCAKDGLGNFTMEGWGSIIHEVRTRFELDLIVLPNLHLLDAQQVGSVGMNTLKSTIKKLKEFLTDCIGKSMGLLPATLGELSAWIKKLKGSCPIVTWSNFVKYVRGKINPLVLEGHVIDLVNEMQIYGEVVYLPRSLDDQEDAIVLNPKWLATEVLGRMFSYETIQSSSIGGLFTPEQLSSLFSEVDFQDLQSILQRMEFCVESLYADGQTLYYFPALDFTTSPLDIWEGWSSKECISGATTPSSQKDLCDSQFPPEDLWQGIRISSCPERDILGNQINVLYPRIVVELSKSFRREICPVVVKKVQQWATGMKVEGEGFATVIYLSRKDLDVITRGKHSKEKSMFEFSDYCLNIISSKILQACPGLSLQKLIISIEDLIKASKTNYSSDASGHLRCYKTKEILEAIVNQKELNATYLAVEVVKETNADHHVNHQDSTQTFHGPEKLVDLLAFGSRDVFSLITFGTEVEVSHLSIHARFALAQLLDINLSPGTKSETNENARQYSSWKELAEYLKVHDVKADNLFDVEKKAGVVPISKTDQILAAWSQQKEATIRKLAAALQDIKRPDARDVLLSLSPIFMRSELLDNDIKLL